MRSFKKLLRKFQSGKVSIIEFQSFGTQYFYQSATKVHSELYAKEFNNLVELIRFMEQEERWVATVTEEVDRFLRKNLISIY